MKENLLCPLGQKCFKPIGLFWHFNLFLSGQMQNCSKKAAFSLVEMLMALLVASLLMAALAPVMTKKFNENVVVSGTGNSIIPSGGCVFTAADGLQEEACTIPSNIHTINAIIASGGGGGGGAVQTAFSTTKSSSEVSCNNPGSANSNEIILSKNMLDVSVHLVGGGGGGSHGMANGRGYPANQTDCGNWGVYIGPEYNGANGTGNTTLPNVAGEHPLPSAGYHSVCVSRYDPSSNPADPSPLMKVDKLCNHASQDCNIPSCTSGGRCCWSVVTHGTDDCEGASSVNAYGGCNRTVCQYNASKNTCATWRPAGPSYGRLPYEAELRGWARGIQSVNSATPGILNKRASGANAYMGFADYPGLQLCEQYSGYGAPMCKDRYDCYGADSNSCWRHVLWSDNASITAHLLLGGVRILTGYNNNAAAIPRCVIDRISSCVPYVGGAGGSGLYAEMKIPDDALRKAYEEGGTVKIIYTAGGPGAGSNVKTSSSDSKYIKLGNTSRFSTPTAGEASSATLTVGGVTKWKFSVPGGKPGNPATTSATGSPANAVNKDSTADACYYKNEYSTIAAYKTGGYFACNTISDGEIRPIFKAGEAGKANGVGADGYFINKITGAGVGGNGSIGGTGGGGGSCSEGPTREYVLCTNAGNGGGGMAKVTYKLARPGLGGSGGGAGAVVHITNISNGIRPGVTFTIKAGKGGIKGAAGTGAKGEDGKDGENSYIAYSTNGTNEFKFEVQGGKGGGGAIAGKPDENIDPIPGGGGTGGKINTTDFNKLVGKSNYTVYPADTEKASGKKSEYTGSYQASAGGNGGINSKISPVESRPCGGLSEIAIDYYGAKDINEDNLKCDLVNTRADASPLPLLEAVIPGSFNNTMAKAMSEANKENYAGDVLPGATGAGGGGWIWKYNEVEQAAAGENGMDGFVIIYWNAEVE